MNLLSIAALVISACTMSAAEAQKLQLRLTTSSDRYRLTDRVRIDARVQNVSEDDVVSIYGTLKWGHAGGLVLRITDANGKDVQPRSLDDDLIIPSTLKDASSFVTLQWHHFIGVDRSDAASDLFTRPGTYTLWLEYLSPVPASFGQGSNFWSRESGKLVSNRVKLQIVASHQ